MGDKFIKIYGVRRTGTTYLQVALEKSFDWVFVNQEGNKHNFPAKSIYNILDDKEEIPYKDYKLNYDNFYFIITIKNPYAWIYSITKWGKKPGRDPRSLKYYHLEYDEFVRDQCDVFNGRYKSWIDLYEKHLSRGYIFIWENTLIDGGYICFRKIQDKFGLSPKGKIYTENNIITTAGKANQYKFNKDFYINKEYLSRYESNIKKIIYNKIDWKLLERLYNHTNNHKLLDNFYLKNT
jgi:hypothetical protein